MLACALIHLDGVCLLIGLQELIPPLPVGSSLLVRSSVFIYIHDRISFYGVSFRLLLMLAGWEISLSFPMTIVIASTCHGNPRTSAGR